MGQAIEPLYSSVPEVVRFLKSRRLDKEKKIENIQIPQVSVEPSALKIDLRWHTEHKSGMMDLKKFRSRTEMNRIAVVIGISRYRKGISRIPGACRDAKDMATFLESPRGGSFERVVFLSNDEASTKRISQALLEIKEYNWDQLVFYFAGHSDESGILAHDGQILYRHLAKFLQQVQADYKLLFLDSCHSEQFIRTLSEGIIKISSADPSWRYLVDLVRGIPGVRAITSTDRHQLASDDISFTQVILKTSEKLCSELPQGTISAKQVFEDASRVLLDFQGDTYQKPQSLGSLMDYPFVVSDYFHPFGEIYSSQRVIPISTRFPRKVLIPLKMKIVNRRHLPTNIQVTCGRDVIYETSVLPAFSDWLFDLPLRLNLPNLLMNFCSLRVRGFDEKNRAICDDKVEIDINALLGASMGAVGF